MANYPKYQGQRMVKEDEYAYIQELIEAHADPSADWGGVSYTAGDGIDITNNTISIDNTVALKNDIPTNADYVDLTTDQTIDGNKSFEDLVLSKTGFGIEVEGQGAIGVIEKGASNNLQIRGNTKLVYGNEVYGLPSKADGNYTLATTDDIPTTATSTSSVTPSTIQLTFTYSDNTTETITLMTGASVTTTTTLS